MLLHYLAFLFITYTSGEQIKFTDSYLAAGSQVITYVIESLEYHPSNEYKQTSETVFERKISNSKLDEIKTFLKGLRDFFWAEALGKGLSKFNGFSQEILEELKLSSNENSRVQVLNVLKKLISKKHTKWTKSENLTKEIISLLEDKNELSDLLESIEPLHYS